MGISYTIIIPLLKSFLIIVSRNSGEEQLNAMNVPRPRIELIIVENSFCKLINCFSI